MYNRTNMKLKGNLLGDGKETHENIYISRMIVENGKIILCESYIYF